jgi:hypothetical protein
MKIYKIFIISDGRNIKKKTFSKNTCYEVNEAAAMGTPKMEAAAFCMKNRCRII